MLEPTGKRFCLLHRSWLHTLFCPGSWGREVKAVKTFLATLLPCVCFWRTGAEGEQAGASVSHEEKDINQSWLEALRR